MGEVFLIAQTGDAISYSNRGELVKDFDSANEELIKLLDSGLQIWLLGAGASYDAKIPLMRDLTTRICSIVDQPNKSILDAVREELPDTAHIEHILSHIADLITLSERSRSGVATVGETKQTTKALRLLHAEIIRRITVTVRYGYRAAQENADTEEVGEADNPIVEITHHEAFVDAVITRRSNLESRSRIIFATTNYDTLIEDALSLAQRGVFDGFSPGGIGYWIGHDESTLRNLPPRFHQVIKLHGSVDWLRASSGKLVRARYGTRYLSRLEDTLIFPQATKYVETQRDPFAELFRAFRSHLMSPEGHVLCIVGYSFGDEHINSEIKGALLRDNNRTNIIAFTKEGDNAPALPAALSEWTSDPAMMNRVYVATNKALYAAGKRFVGPGAEEMSWWTFAGLTTYLKKGVPA